MGQEGAGSEEMSQEGMRVSENAENVALGIPATKEPATKKPGLSLAERLGLVGYRNQSRSEIKPHIVVDTDICKSTCPHKCTTWVCPANCDTMGEDQKMHFQVEDLMESGTCMYACDKGAVDWKLTDPEMGRGVNWNLG